MAWTQVDTRDSSNPNASADINQLQDNCDALKGGTPATAPTTTIETLATNKLAIADIDDTPADDADTAVSSKWIFDNISSVYATALTGAIYAFGNNSTPSGYLLCDGSAVSRTTYAALFAVVGTTWGVGDGSTTFNVPDLRGVFIRGTGSHGTLNMADGNDFAGPSVGSSENDLLQGHYHNTYSNQAFGTVSTFGVVGALSGNTGVASDVPVKEAVTDGSNGTPRTGDETRPVNFGVKYVIKY